MNKFDKRQGIDSKLIYHYIKKIVLKYDRFYSTTQRPE